MSNVSGPVTCWLSIAALMAGCSVPEIETRLREGYSASECWFDNSGAVPASCGWLRPTRQDQSGTAALPVVILPAVPGQRSADAVVYLNGGPGGESGFDDEGLRVLRMRQTMMGLRSDFVVYDQRGSGLSVPPLLCPELDAGVRDEVLAVQPSAQRLQHVWSSLETCLSRVPEADRAASLYSTPTAVGDLRELVNALRSDLGYDGISLYGVSYGTRLAIEAAQAPDLHVRRLVLDSIQPPDAPLMVRYPTDYERMLDDIDEHCRYGVCELPEGGIRELLRQAGEQLARKPYQTRVSDPQRPGQQLAVRLDGEDLFGLATLALLLDDWGPSLIEVLNLLAAGKDDPKVQGAMQLMAVVGLELGVNMVGNLLINCADRPTMDQTRMADERRRFPESAEVAQRDGAAAVLCDRVGIAAPPKVGDWQVDLPTLLVARRMDPLTPLHLIEATRDHFSDARLLVMPGAGHGAIDSDPQLAGLAGRFLDGRIGLDEIAEAHRERFPDPD